MTKNNYSKEIADAIRNFLDEDDWKYSFDEQLGMFRFGLNLGGKLKNVNYIIDVKEDEYVSYAISPVGVDQNDRERMAVMTEFICRANYGLKNGNFELDVRDGELRYKSYVDCDGIIPTEDMIRHSITCPGTMFKRYSEGIVGIIFNDESAEGAINRCEKSDQEFQELLEELRKLADSDDGDGQKMVEALGRLAERFGIPDDFDLTDIANEDGDEDDDADLDTGGDVVDGDTEDGESDGRKKGSKNIKVDLFGTGGVAV